MDFLLASILVGDNPWLEDPTSFGAAARRHLPATYLPRTLEQRLNAGGLAADRATLHYLRSKSRSKSGAGVDFVIDHGDEIAGIEVKASQMTRPRLSRSARSFIEAYAPARFVVVNTGLTDTLAIGDTTVQWIQGHELSAWVGPR